jgi:hypothetical protein
MSDELPDDPSQWPDDPHALLGVHPGVDPTELKRAYTKLIRRFKPEQAPEQFRRIREAYDRLLSYARFFQQFKPEFEATAPPDASMTPPPDSQPIAPRTDPLAEAWQLAITGDPQAACQRLRGIHESSPGPEAAVRLYWLATLFPELESERKPVEWLVGALRRSNLSGTARELFRRELLDHPRAAFHESIAGLWQVDAEAERIAELADWRWHAAALMQSWYVIQEDLDLLRELIRRASETAWLRLLAAAADLLAWYPAGSAQQQIWNDCLAEISGLEQFLAHDNGYIFDRVDLLKVIANDWHAWRLRTRTPPDILSLLPLVWTRPMDELWPMFWHLADQIRRDPRSWLDNLDEPRQKGPNALRYLADQFRMLPVEGVNADCASRTIPHLGAFLVSDFWEHYFEYRYSLLDFCLQNEITPEWVAERATLAGAVGTDGFTPTQLIRYDGAIVMVCHAVQCLRE